MTQSKLFMIAAICAGVVLFSSVAHAQMKKCTENGSIKKVMKSRSGNFELVTFEVLSKSPDYTVGNAHPPFSEYGSEKPLRIKGKSFKSIVFRGINWTCRIEEQLSAKTSTIMAVKSIEQFEGQVEYIIGFTAKSKFVGASSTGSGKSRKVILRFKK